MKRRLRPRRRRPAFTLAELLVSTASAGLLLAGMMSSIYVASRASDVDATVARTIDGSQLAEQIAEELTNATSFREKTATSVTFNVADRDADGDPEIIRYAKSSGSLIRTYNATQSTVATNVANFTLSFATVNRTGTNRLLFVHGNASPNSLDLARISTITGWGYSVLTIPATSSQATFDWHVALVDVAYVSGTVVSTDLNTKLLNATVGVVCEPGGLWDENNGFAFCDSDGAAYTSQEINIHDNGHYITETNSTGPLTIATASVTFEEMDSTMGLGVQMLGKRTSKAVLAVANTGDRLYADPADSGPAAKGPRVALPWGQSAFNPSALNAAGLTLWRRSVDWAARKVLVTDVDIVLQIGSDSAARIQTSAQVLSQPDA